MEDLNWYVIRVKPGMEERFVDWLLKNVTGVNNYCSEFLIPETEIKGKKGLIVKKTYPGYVFIKMIMADVVLRKVLSSPFVLKFLGGAGSIKPKIITEEEIENIRNMIKKEVAKDSNKLFSGDEVTILDEAFKFYTGVIDYVDEKNSNVKVNVVFFGKLMSITFKLHQVQKK